MDEITEEDLKELEDAYWPMAWREKAVKRVIHALREARAENERLRKAARNVVADWLDPPKDARDYDYTMEILKQTLEDK